MGPVSTVGQIVTVVGIGADGWAGLAEPAREAVRAAEVVLGWAAAARPRRRVHQGRAAHVAVADAVRAARAVRRARRPAGGVLASGDPMFHGVGATLARLLGAGPAARRAAPVVGVAGLRPARAGPSTGSRSSARSPARSPGSAACSHRARGCWC